MGEISLRIHDLTEICLFSFIEPLFTFSAVCLHFSAVYLLLVCCLFTLSQLFIDFYSAMTKYAIK